MDKLIEKIRFAVNTNTDITPKLTKEEIALLLLALEEYKENRK